MNTKIKMVAMALLTMLGIAAYAQNSKEPIKLYTMVGNNGKTGCVDKDKQLIIPYEYDRIVVDFGKVVLVNASNGFIKAEKNGKTGMIDMNNHVVIPFEYERIESSAYYNHSFGMTLADDLVRVKKDGKWGVVNTNNQCLIPFEYSSIGTISDGLFSVNKNGKFGFVDKSNRLVIPLEYDDVFESFNDGYAVVVKDDKPFVINKSNTMIYELVLDGKGDDGVMIYREGGKVGYIDKNFKVLIPAEYDNGAVYKSGCAVVNKNGKWGKIDKNNKIIIPFIYDSYIDVVKNANK